MRRRMLKSKIHRATATDANPDYVGSVTVDARLLKMADIAEFEQVQVLDVTNGVRLETYAIAGGPGQVCLNGAAARLIDPGDTVIIVSYADYEPAEMVDYAPMVVHVDTANRALPAFDDAPPFVQP